MGDSPFEWVSYIQAQNHSKPVASTLGMGGRCVACNLFGYLAILSWRADDRCPRRVKYNGQLH